MDIEVDQSGKIEDTATDTVIAFSNKKCYSVLIPATVKRSCLERLRQKGKTGKSIYRRMFTIGLFILLKGKIRKHDFIIIDIEYTGHSRTIKEQLINLLSGVGTEIDPGSVSFQRIGKKSPAHSLAYLTHRGDVKANQIIKFEGIMKYLRK